MKGNNPRIDVALLILRVGLGLIAMYYGSQKMLGAFGGPGPKQTIDFMRSTFGIPAPFAILAMCAEFLGGLGLVVGLLTPVAAFGICCTMAVATYENCKDPSVLEGVLHGNNADASKAFYSLVILLGALTLMLIGAGRYSLDGKFFVTGKGRR
jgi:putative oxidoreductase